MYYICIYICTTHNVYMYVLYSCIYVLSHFLICIYTTYICIYTHTATMRGATRRWHDSQTHSRNVYTYIHLYIYDTFIHIWTCIYTVYMYLLHMYIYTHSRYAWPHKAAHEKTFRHRHIHTIINMSIPCIYTYNMYSYIYICAATTRGSTR